MNAGFADRAVRFRSLRPSGRLVLVSLSALAGWLVGGSLPADAVQERTGLQSAGQMQSSIQSGAGMEIRDKEELLCQARQELWAGRERSAVPLFRRYLGRHPDDRDARLDLARALAWSGRLHESMQTYRLLDSGRPADADVLSGMGDILAWSGRPAEALDLYRRALTIDPKRDATKESAARLAHHEGALVRGGSERFHDSGGTLAHGTTLEFRPGEASRGGPVIRFSREEISHSAGGDGPPLSTLGASAGWDGWLGAGVHGRVICGATRTGSERARTWSESRVSLRTLRRLSLDLSHTFRDVGYELSSPEARRHGLTGHELSLSGYRSFSAESGLYARLRGGFLSDGNAWRGGDLSFDMTAWKRPDARVAHRVRAVLSLYAKDFDSASGIYYAARGEWAAAAGARMTLYQDSRMTLDASARGGRAGNESGRGEILGAGGTAAWRLTPARVLEAGFTYDQSIQTATYIRRVWRLGLRWSV